MNHKLWSFSENPTLSHSFKVIRYVGMKIKFREFLFSCYIRNQEILEICEVLSNWFPRKMIFLTSICTCSFIDVRSRWLWFLVNVFKTFVDNFQRKRHLRPNRDSVTECRYGPNHMVLVESLWLWPILDSKTKSKIEPFSILVIVFWKYFSLPKSIGN